MYFYDLVLNVLYAPRADLKFGASINPANIIEGQDVYMECMVDANPKLNKILWKKDGLIVVPLKNLLMSGMNLVLQGVHRNQTGNYTCTVSNNIGDSESSPVDLKVKYWGFLRKWIFNRQCFFFLCHKIP